MRNHPYYSYFLVNSYKWFGIPFFQSFPESNDLKGNLALRMHHVHWRKSQFFLVAPISAFWKVSTSDKRLIDKWEIWYVRWISSRNEWFGNLLLWQDKWNIRIMAVWINEVTVVLLLILVGPVIGDFFYFGVGFFAMKFERSHVTQKYWQDHEYTHPSLPWILPNVRVTSIKDFTSIYVHVQPVSQHIAFMVFLNVAIFLSVTVVSNCILVIESEQLFLLDGISYHVRFSRKFSICSMWMNVSIFVDQ